jgi:hypothetical protein
MSSTTNIEIVFEGPRVEGGTIDARLLADALAGCSDVFERSNQIINGEDTNAMVLVKSGFRPGSFIVDIQLVQITEQVQSLILAHPVVSAATLTGIIGFVSKHKEEIKESVIKLYKFLRGKKADKVEQVGGNSVEITFGQNKKTVTTNVYNLYLDGTARAGFAKLVKPLNRGVDRIAVKQNGDEQVVIEKSEAEYFETQFELETDNSPTEGERDAVLTVSKLSFKEGVTWTFFERGSIVIAKIEDEEFWANVHKHKITFGEGDRLRVRLRWKIERKKKLVQSNVISKVYEVLESPKQLQFNE